MIDDLRLSAQRFGSCQAISNIELITKTVLNMSYRSIKVLLLVQLAVVVGLNQSYSQAETSWSWPEGKQAALSLTFDDARQSQVLTGTALLDSHNVKATFYVVPESMKPVLDGWKTAVSNGHEIGNHTLYHPCTGNFQWRQDHALEDYTVAQMRAELIETNHQINQLLGVEAVSYAYTCGQKFVGHGTNTHSYIPVVADLFQSGRGFLDETANDRAYMDLAQLTGIESDGKDFEEIKPVLEQARENGGWVVLAGHEIGEGGRQTTRTAMLEELIAYAQDPANGIWLTTVKEIADYVEQQRSNDPQNSLKESLTFHASFDHGFDADYHQGNGSIYTAAEYGKLEQSTKGMHAKLVQHRPDSGRYGGAIEYTGKSKPVLYYRSEDNIEYQSENWSGTISLWLQLNPEEDLEPGYCDPIQITDEAYNDAALWVDFSDKNPRNFRMGVFGDLEAWNPRNIGPGKNVDFDNRLITAKDRPFGRDQWTHVVISFQRMGTRDSSTSDLGSHAGSDSLTAETDTLSSPGSALSATDSTKVQETDAAEIGPSTGRVDFYINGIHQGHRDIPEPFTWDLQKSKIFIGLNYVGLIDDLAIFNKGLSEEEVGMLYGLEGGVGELW